MVLLSKLTVSQADNVLQANILVNDEHVAQLADFGQSTVGDGTVNGSMSNSAGHPRWLAPELMFPENFNGSGKSTQRPTVLMQAK